MNDFSQGKGAKAAPNWKVLGLGSSGHTWTSKPAQAFADGIGFAFGSGNPDTKLFLTSHPGSGLLGDLTGKTLTATVTITGTATAFTYYKEGDPENDGKCGTPAPASVRLYFEGKTNFENNHQWWSNPQAYTLTSHVGDALTVTVPLDTANWPTRSAACRGPLRTFRPTLRPRSRRSARSVSRSAAAASPSRSRAASRRPTAPHRSS